MSRRSKSGDEFGSLDLLLDTVCNMFGLFIFIGIIVAILAGARSKELITKASPAGATASDPLSQERSALQRLRAMVADAEKKSPDEGESLIASGKLTSLRDANQKTSKKTKELASILKSGGERSEALQVELPSLRAEIERLESDLQIEAASPDKKVRAPRKREVEGMLPVQVILWRDRLYWINPWVGSIDEPCTRWSEWNINAVDMSAHPESVVHECFRGGGQWIERRVPLLAAGGLEVGQEGVREWEQPLRELLGRLSTKNHVISLKVTPDSHRAFGPVRSLIAEKGFAYEVSPIQMDDGIYRDEIRDGVTTAQ